MAEGIALAIQVDEGIGIGFESGAGDLSSHVSSSLSWFERRSMPFTRSVDESAEIASSKKPSNTHNVSLVEACDQRGARERSAGVTKRSHGRFHLLTGQQGTAFKRKNNTESRPD